MIDFRYHLVSLIAVFLAVALGIVIGTTALNGGLLDNLQTQVSGLQEDKRSLEDTNQGLQAQLDSTGGFAEEVGPALVAGTLTGRSVLLLVGNEDVDTDAVDEVSALLGDAGATVSGTIRLDPAYSDPQTTSSLQNYLTTAGALPPGVTLPADTSDTGELVAGLLAQVLMIPPAGEGEPQEVPDTTATAQVLGGLSTLGVLTQDSAGVAPADYAVLLTSGSLTADDAAERNAVLVQLVTALDDRGSGAVVSGDAGAAADGGLVGTIRADAEVSTRVSTVDNANAPEGRISTVLALSAEGEGTSGTYGTGDGARRRAAHPGRQRERGRQLMASRLALAAAGAVLARAGLAGALAGADRPGAARWRRTNYAGRPLTLLGGPVLAAAATATATAGAPAGWGPATALVGAVSGMVGGYDDLAGARPDQARDKGLAGHLAALRAGRVSAGAVKVAGIGTAAAVAAVLTRRGSGPAALVDGVLTTGLVAGTANLVNLLDLRPGRAAKAGSLLAAGLLGGPSGASVAGPLGAALAVLPTDLAERVMLGDAGANALGALLGLRLAAGRSRATRTAALAVVTGLTLASEKVSFTRVIESTPVLREVDRLGRRTP